MKHTGGRLQRLRRRSRAPNDFPATCTGTGGSCRRSTATCSLRALMPLRTWDARPCRRSRARVGGLWIPRHGADRGRARPGWAWGGV